MLRRVLVAACTAAAFSGVVKDVHGQCDNGSGVAGGTADADSNPATPCTAGIKANQTASNSSLPEARHTASATPLDAAIVLIYLVGIVAVGLRSSRSKQTASAGAELAPRAAGDSTQPHEGTPDGDTAAASEFFLAGRSLTWPVIGVALFATNISTIHVVGLAGSGFSVGLVVGNFEWFSAMFALPLLGLLFAPFYYTNEIATLPEYVERRYSAQCRSFLAFTSVVAALFIHIGVSLYAGAVLCKNLLGVPVLLSIFVVSFLTAIYTLAGGLRAVVVTEVIQTVILLFGSMVIIFTGIKELSVQGIDTWEDLVTAASTDGVDRMSMIHSAESDPDFPFYSFILGYPVLGIWYWCTDQTIVQRVLGAATLRDAQLGPLFAAAIKILPVPLFVFPGVMAYILFRDQVEVADDAVFVLIHNLVPPGAKGLILAGMLSALMSTIAGALNSVSTLISIDIYQKLRPNASNADLLRIGRITAVVVMVLATAWSTMGDRFGGIFVAVNAMISCLSPPITVVFLMGALWRRGTTEAAQATLVLGFVFGVFTFCLDFFTSPMYLTEVQGIPFLMQAWWLICISFALFIATSLATPPPAEHQLRGLCFDLAATRRRAEVLRAAQGNTIDAQTTGEGGCPDYMRKKQNFGCCVIVVSVILVVLCRAANLSALDPSVSTRGSKAALPEQVDNPVSRLIDWVGLVFSLLLLVYGLYVRRLASREIEAEEPMRVFPSLEELQQHPDAEVAKAAEYAMSMSVAQRISIAIVLLMLCAYSFVR